MKERQVFCFGDPANPEITHVTTIENGNVSTGTISSTGLWNYLAQHGDLTPVAHAQGTAAGELRKSA